MKRFAAIVLACVAILATASFAEAPRVAMW